MVEKANTLQEFEENKEEVKEVSSPTPEGKKEVEETKKPVEDRSEKEVMAENKRKTEQIEKLQLELDQQKQSQPTQAPPQTTWIDNINQMAENEMATTGRTVPMQTIGYFANVIAQNNLDKTLKTREQARDAIEEFEDSIQDELDFKENKREFRKLVRQLKPDQVNSTTLEIALNSIRGKKMKELLKTKPIEKPQILGAPTEATGGAVQPKTSLTPDQQTDKDRMNSETDMGWTDGEYKEMLLKKQNKFKISGAKNVPQTLSEQMIK